MKHTKKLTAEGARRLLRLADFLRRLPPEKFCYSTVRNNCGTIGCAIGWTPEALPDLVKKTGGGNSWKHDSSERKVNVVDLKENVFTTSIVDFLEIACRLFGITSYTAEKLFCASDVNAYIGRFGIKAQPADVAERIEHFVKTGVVLMT